MKKYYRVQDYEGPVHGDELYYLFKNRDQRFAPRSEDIDDQTMQVRELMCKMWTNFAKFGNPNKEKDNSTTEWIPVVNKRLCVLKIGNANADCVMYQNKENEKRSRFWKDIHDKYGDKFKCHF